MLTNKAIMQERFDTVQEWMCNAEGIRDNNIRNHLASGNANYSLLWEHAITNKEKDDLLRTMYVRVYSSKCDDSITNIQLINSTFGQSIIIPERETMTWEVYHGTMSNVRILCAYASVLHTTLQIGMQRCFEQAHAWLCDPDEIDNEEIRGRLVIYAHGIGSTSMWANAHTQQEKEDMLTSMYIEKYSAICDEYHIRIYKLIALYNLDRDMSHPSGIPSTQGTYRLSALKSYMSRLQLDIQMCKKEGENKFKYFKQYWGDIKTCLIMQWDRLLSTQPGCIGQLTNGNGECVCAHDIMAFPAIFDDDGMFGVGKMFASPQQTIHQMERLLAIMQAQS